MPPFLLKLFGGPVIEKLLAYIPDPQAKAKAALEAQQSLEVAQEKLDALIAEQNSKQADINLEEAKNSNLFIAGWRPALGWVLASSFAWVYVLQPLLTFALNAAHHPVTLPTIDFSTMSTVLMGMLGLAGLRTYEKKTNSEGNR
jgi:hypothetical protein